MNYIKVARDEISVTGSGGFRAKELVLEKDSYANVKEGVTQHRQCC